MLDGSPSGASPTSGCGVQDRLVFRQALPCELEVTEICLQSERGGIDLSPQRWVLSDRDRHISQLGTFEYYDDLQGLGPFEDSGGRQFPGLSVIARGEDGSPRHIYSACAIMKEVEYRGLDLYTPVWNLLDLLPQGRGEWMPSVEYAD